MSKTTLPCQMLPQKFPKRFKSFPTSSIFLRNFDIFKKLLSISFVSTFSPGLGAGMVEARDKLSAIRQRTEDAEKRYRNKEGNPLRFWGIWQKLGEKMEKLQKENDKEVQNLIMLMARRAGII